MIAAPSPATHQVPAQWTVLSLIQWSTTYLEEKGFDEARLHAELLLAHVLGLTRLQLYLQFDRPLTPGELASYKALFQRRLAHEPLQYVLGETVFMGLPLSLAPGVLIPRPETELLVEKVVDFVRSCPRDHVEILDVGTGSGNIALAVAHLAPAAHVTAVDVSPEAIRVASANKARHGLSRVVLEERDIRKGAQSGEKYDVVVSNPPYIALEEYLTLEPEVRSFEPRAALTDEADGLQFFDVLFAFATTVLTAEGRIFCEIGHGQADAVRALAVAHGFRVLDVSADLAGIPRVLEGCMLPVSSRKG